MTALLTALLTGVLAGWCVLRLSGADRRWPWRVAQLGPAGPPSPGTHRRGRRVGSGPRPDRSRPRARRHLDEEIERDVCEVAELLALAVTSGHTLHGAVAAVAAAGHGPVAAELATVTAAWRRGASLVEELSRMPQRLGPSVRALVGTLVLTSSSGAPLAPALQRLADHARRRLRRRAEERVRRLPVMLLAPLVGLVLPAFVVLTIVPVALSTARSAAELALPPNVPLHVPPAAAEPIPRSRP